MKIYFLIFIKCFSIVACNYDTAKSNKQHTYTQFDDYEEPIEVSSYVSDDEEQLSSDETWVVALAFAAWQCPP